MVKKILALTVAIMLLSVTALGSVSNTVLLAQASEEITGETKTYNIWNTVDGTTSKGVPAKTDENANLTQRVALHVRETGRASTNWGTNANSYVNIGYDGTYDMSLLLRFPLNLQLPANEKIVKAELSITASSAQTLNLQLNAYESKFTDVPFGQAMSVVTLPYSELTAADSLIGSVQLNGDVASYTAAKMDITGYIDKLIQAGANSADIAIAAPNATVAGKFISVMHETLGTAAYKPNLVITTEVDPNYGIPAIDTVANEGKTKIRMQTTDTAFSNTSCGIFMTNKSTITYNVNAKTAGKYYFSVYTASNQLNGSEPVSAKPGSLTVNGTKFNDSDSVYSVCNIKKDTTILTDPAVTPNYLYHNIYEIDLNKGANTIAVYKGTSSQYGIAYVELTNYARTAATDTKAIAEKGIEILAAVQPIVTVKPTAVYKVYDTIAAANAATGNVVMELAGGTTSNETCYYIAASYDSNHVMQDVELLSFPHNGRTSRTVDFGGFSLEGVSYITVFALDGTTLTPVASSVGTIN